MLRLQRLFLFFVVSLACHKGRAQQVWSSPELETMYRNGEIYLARGGIKEAITTFRQAVLLAPGNMLLHRELAKAQNLYADYIGAEKTLSEFITGYPSSADDSCYQILAWSRQKQDRLKEARRALNKGLKRFPASGILYRGLGSVYLQEGAQGKALNAWIDGTENAPSFPWNYYDAANVYLSTDNVLWGILYGELFINLTQDTASAEQMKSLLFSGYKKMFENIVRPKGSRGAGFENAVLSIFRQLTPVVSDGITTENLTMVRTRFIMDWFATYARTYPFALFTYQDQLIRTGHFEIYNEWLFGNAEQHDEYEAWNKFHEGDIVRLSEWRIKNPLKTVVTAHYNARNFNEMFKRKTAR